MAVALHSNSLGAHFTKHLSETVNIFHKSEHKDLSLTPLRCTLWQERKRGPFRRKRLEEFDFVFYGDAFYPLFSGCHVLVAVIMQIILFSENKMAINWPIWGQWRSLPPSISMCWVLFSSSSRYRHASCYYWTASGRLLLE